MISQKLCRSTRRSMSSYMSKGTFSLVGMMASVV